MERTVLDVLKSLAIENLVQGNSTPQSLTSYGSSNSTNAGLPIPDHATMVRSGTHTRHGCSFSIQERGNVESWHA